MILEKKLDIMYIENRTGDSPFKIVKPNFYIQFKTPHGEESIVKYFTENMGPDNLKKLSEGTARHINFIIESTEIQMLKKYNSEITVKAYSENSEFKEMMVSNLESGTETHALGSMHHAKMKYEKPKDTYDESKDTCGKSQLCKDYLSVREMYRITTTNWDNKPFSREDSSRYVIEMGNMIDSDKVSIGSLFVPLLEKEYEELRSMPIKPIFKLNSIIVD